ncbi:MAG TPA: hypothetical protein VM531_03420, partial [Sphingomicrobium sp.]|nr:hypothetical protein [Sphingomicrobium sp.]
MNTELRNALVTGPHTAKALAAIIGKSESRTRELLKAHAEEIQCRKEEGKNVFWVASDGNQETPINPDLANLQSEAEVTTVSDDPDTCPLCDSSANQVQAGPDGEFLGAAKTCSACNRTYNVHSREEITMPTPTAKGKRKPLNPQYKIDA